MKLSTRSEYSLLILVYLARHVGTEDFVSLEKVCDFYDIPLKYAEQLAGVLKQNRFVSARRGSAGGYRLARSADRIVIAEVVRLMDGALAPTGAVSEYFFTHTPIEKEEKMLNIFRQVRNFIADLLEKTTLADLA